MKVSAYDLALLGGKCVTLAGEEAILLPDGLSIWYYASPKDIWTTPCGQQWMYQRVN